MTEPMQRHPIFPSHLVSAPDDYPEPKAGKEIHLTTPEGVAVGTLTYDDVGLHWSPASTEDESAQDHAAELLNFIRGNKNAGTPLAEVVAAIRQAYAV